MATTHLVRPAATVDVPGMAEALALAFQDDPVMAWLFGADQERTVPHLRRFFTFEGKRHLHSPTVFTTEGHDGAAYWSPPGQWKLRPLHMLGMAPLMLRAMARRLPSALKGFTMMEKAHARHPEHYYLAVLGTRPDRQGHGIGAALMAPILDHCDEHGIGAYLESSKESNIPFYARHGFEVVEEIRFPKGPGLWPMWRNPQDPAESS
jgi:GNAT superfamily N-acetyltransferase